MRRFVKTSIWLVPLLLLTFWLGQFSTGSQAEAGGKDPYARLDIFAKILRYVETNYVKPVDSQRLIDGAINGMLDTLDPHSSYLPPDLYKEMKIDATGEFRGLGLLLEQRDGELTVLSALDGSPANQANIGLGDRILRINGQSTARMSLHEAIRSLRGDEGSSVGLTLLKQGETRPKEMTLTRRKIDVTSVDGRLLAQGIGYIRIRAFQEGTSDDVVRLLTQEEVASGGKLRGVVLDLRGNPGGLLDEGVKVADEFLAQGAIVTTQGRLPSQRETHLSTSRGRYQNGPLVVLVNGGSASASEILSGALKDHRRAVLFGSTTFGKGSVQTLIELDDGSALKLTIAHYLTPSGRSIQKVGIKPDLFVPDLPPERWNDEVPQGSRRLLASAAPLSLPQPDPQLQAAFSYLSQEMFPVIP